MLLASCGSVPKTSLPSIPEGPPIASVDDSLYARALERAITSSGTVSYTKLVSDSDLTAYLRQVAAVRTDAFTSRSELLAFWINVHNAYVLDIIRSNMGDQSSPVRSIDDISGFRYAKVVLAGGDRYSLDDIEHSIIERQFREPRAFFALFDGTRSSPLLQRIPYAESTLSEELDRQLKTFLGDSTKNYLDRRTNTLYLSPIFETYANDLGEAAGGTVAAFVRDFAPPAMAQWIAGHRDITISYLRYDYTINTNDIGTTHEPTYKPALPRRPSGGIR
jgi:hypothetical protein